MSINMFVPPSAGNTARVKSSHNITGNNASAIKLPIFQFTGNIVILKLYGVVTTALGAHHTAPYFTEYDGSTRNEISSSTLPPDASNYPIGSLLLMYGKTSTALLGRDATNCNIGEAAVANLQTFQECVLTSKTATTTQIEYVYSTTDAPTTGAIDFYIEVLLLDDSATIVAI